MAAQPFVVVVRPHHHGQGIPAHQRTNAALHEQVPRHQLLVAGGDGIAKRRGNRRGQAYTGFSGVLGKLNK